MIKPIDICMIIQESSKVCSAVKPLCLLTQGSGHARQYKNELADDEKKSRRQASSLATKRGKLASMKQQTCLLTQRRR